MGQKTNPIGNRLGIIRGWDSSWFDSKNFADNVIQDQKIRDYLNARIRKGGLARIIIERSLNKIILTLHTSRPGIIIGKGGSEVDRLREELKKFTGNDVQINIVEIRKPEMDAAIVAESVASQLEGRVNFRRAVKMAIQSTMRAGAEGIKIRVAGRLNGAEMARTEEYKEGRIPLHTFRADIDYALCEANTIYGKIGVKVWICKGEVLGKRDLSPNVGVKSRSAGRRNDGGRRNEGGRKGGGRGRNKSSN